MLSPTQCDFYREQGYLHVPGVFSPKEMEGLETHLAILLRDWAQTDIGWTGPWRKEYMDEATE
jgi:hypothetical protein